MVRALDQEPHLGVGGERSTTPTPKCDYSYRKSHRIKFGLMIKIYIDGGTVGSRICLVDKLKNKTLVKIRGVDPTNNELEYLALVYALQYITNNYKRRNITIYSDSLLVVSQINGKWRVTTPKLLPLWNKCMKMVTDKIKIKWISRDFNEAGWVLDALRGK